MFIIAALVGENEAVFKEKIDSHFAKLQETKFVGNLKWIHFKGATIAYDSTSPYVKIHKSEDTFSIIGGWKSASKTENEGEYIQIHLDILQGVTSLEANSDPAGSWPVYGAESEIGIAVGNDVLAIALGLGLSNLNTNVINEFLLYGHAITRETTVKGIKRVWPGERFSTNYKNNLQPELMIAEIPGPTTFKYQLGAETSSTQVLGCLRADSELLPKVDEYSIVQLSGGLDSRLTAAVLSELNPLITTATIRFENEEEIDIAHKVAKALKTKHHQLTLDGLVERDLFDGWLLTSGQVNPYAAAGNLPLYKANIPGIAQSPRKIFGAWPGDCLIGSYIPQSNVFLTKSLYTFAMKSWLKSREVDAKALRQASSWHIRNLFVYFQTRRRLRHELQKVSNGNLIQTISFWAMFRRQPAFSYVSPARLTADVMEITPVLGTKYIASLLRLSDQDIYAKNFYRKMILSGFPNLKEIKYHNTGKPIDDTQLGHNKKVTFSDLLRIILPKSIVMWLGSTLNLLNRSNSRTTDLEETKYWLTAPKIREMIDNPLTVSGLNFNIARVKTNKTKLVFASILLGMKWTEQYLLSGGQFPNHEEI